MAFFFGDGFDLYALPADTILGHWDSGGTGFTLVAGRFSGSRAIAMSSIGNFVVKASGQNDAVHHIFCAYQTTAASLTGTGLANYLTLSDAATNQCSIVFRTDGVIVLTSGPPTGTVLATYTGAVTAVNTWFSFEFEVVINNTTGSFAVRKNGNTSNDFTATSLNTRPGTNSYANRLSVGCQANNPGGVFDDLLWRSDAASVPWVGDIRCYTRRPASDVAVQWARTGGGTGNFQAVDDDQQDGLTTYVSSANVGDSDLYTLSSITSTPTAVIGVTTRALMQKSDAGSRTVAVQVKSGATTVESAAVALNTTWGWVERTDLVDPATGAAWTAVGVNNAQIGVVVKT